MNNMNCLILTHSLIIVSHTAETYLVPKTQLTRLKHIQNSLARAVVAAPRSSDPDQILKSLHWLKVHERIEYKIISTIYKVLQSSSPHYLRDIITIQPSRSTRSSSLVGMHRIAICIILQEPDSTG